MGIRLTDGVITLVARETEKTLRRKNSDRKPPLGNTVKLWAWPCVSLSLWCLSHICYFKLVRRVFFDFLRPDSQTPPAVIVFVAGCRYQSLPTSSGLTFSCGKIHFAFLHQRFSN